MVKKAGPLAPPRLPPDLTPLTDVPLADDLYLSRVTIQGDYSGRGGDGVTLEEVRIATARFTGSTFGRLRMTDVMVEDADFSGVDMEEASLSRVVFRDCRMSGLVLARAVLRDVVFLDCKLDGANFRMVDGERVTFNDVNLREAEFTAGRLAAACFFDCDLAAAEFSQVAMSGARLHGSAIAEIKGVDSLRGVVIDSTQVYPVALQVLRSLQIRIDDAREEGAAATAD